MKIEEGRTTVIDTMDKIHVNKHGDIECCRRELRYIAHGDGRDCTTSTCNCDCGNVIIVKNKRDKESKKWWE